LISFIPLSLIIVSVIINYFSPLTTRAVIRVLLALKRRRRLEAAAALESQDNLRDSTGSDMQYQPQHQHQYQLEFLDQSSMELFSNDEDASSLILRHLMPGSPTMGTRRNRLSRDFRRTQFDPATFDDDDDDAFGEDFGPDERDEDYADDDDADSSDASSSTSEGGAPGDDQPVEIPLDKSQEIPRPMRKPKR